ncbi:MAG: OmpH family outer membrane protein [Nitrospirota bacterium]|nr:OmpH family outer membrane protein [Nitrospirota bacterium]
MKKILFTIVSVLIALNAYAADMKIGYVDLNKALNTSETGKKAVKVLEDMVRAKQKFIDQKGDDIKKLDEELSKQSSVLNPETLKEKQEERDRLMRDYQRMVKDSQDEIQKKQTGLMQDIIKEMRQVVHELGKKEGYSLILERSESGILYIPDNLDLTDKLIQQFNEVSKKTGGK